MFTLILTLALIVAVLFGVLWHLSRWNKTHDFECPNCGKVFSLSLSDMISSPHRLRECSVKCPGCGAIVWAVPVPKPQPPGNK